MSEQTGYERARDRVYRTPELAEHTDILLDYDWPNMDEHLIWVATADVSEILDWITAIERED